MTWFADPNIDYSIYKTKKTIVTLKHPMLIDYEGKKIYGLFKDIIISDKDSNAQSISIYTGIFPHYHIITNDIIKNIFVDNSNELHKKYLYCKDKLIEYLPEEIVMKEIFSFIKRSVIAI